MSLYIGIILGDQSIFVFSLNPTPSQTTGYFPHETNLRDPYNPSPLCNTTRNKLENFCITSKHDGATGRGLSIGVECPSRRLAKTASAILGSSSCIWPIVSLLNVGILATMSATLFWKRTQTQWCSHKTEGEHSQPTNPSRIRNGGSSTSSP